MSGAIILAAPSSGSGKTTITLGLLRALKQRGLNVRGAKSGPDYIDPRFHEAACGQTCFNLDAWAMPAGRIGGLTSGDGPLLIEGAMGLFDGAPPEGKGATADLARMLNIPVVMIVDASHMAQSIAPLVNGFASHDPSVNIAGLILNKVGSPRHETMLRTALEPLGIPVLGAVHRNSALVQPSRHLGLVQAEERPDLDSFIDQAAQIVADSIDLDGFTNLLRTATPLVAAGARRLTPPAQRIAVAQDQAFAFAYPHILKDWREGGAEVTFFSPLRNEAPTPCDMVILPGGYPELHAAQLAAAQSFKTAVRKIALNRPVYGECGGYMVLGEQITDASGQPYEMLGLLPLETSFQNRKLHLGYRTLEPLGGPFGGTLKAHEFHYATTLRAEGTPLFRAQDATGAQLEDMGLINGHVSGSFAHIIDRA